ncbi:MAG: hypothetical protein ABSB82_01320 [Terriglobia bacterium]
MTSSNRTLCSMAIRHLMNGLVLVSLVGTVTLLPRPLKGADWSTLFTAQDVHKYLSTGEGRAEALKFCRRMGISKVYIEVFRDGYQADSDILKTSRDEFRRAGLKVSGCVTTTGLGKPSTGWNVVACYTNRANRSRLAKIFQSAAEIFDEIMIDDFFFTDCECSECAAARGGMSWREYRKNLMLQVSRDSVLGPARAANPNVKIILKYPQWYDKFQDRGYSVAEESALYDRVWVGTELRDPSSDEWGHTQQYRGFFLYRWLTDVAGTKNGGGWFDPYGTDPTFYLDQAYVTLLAGAPETFLFHYGALASEYPAQAEALAAERPKLDNLGKLITGWHGIPAYKPPSSDPGDEAYLFDQIGMLAIPLQPTSHFPQDAPAAIFAAHALEDAEFVPKLVRFLNAGHTALVSEGLAHLLDGDPRLPAPDSISLAKGELFKTVREGSGTLDVFSDALPHLTYVDAQNKTQSLTPKLRAALASLRSAVAGFEVTSPDAPPRVAVFPIGSRVAVANFTEFPVACHLAIPGSSGKAFHQVFAASGASLEEDAATLGLPPHGLLVVE